MAAQGWFRQPYALLVITIMIGGVVAGAFFYFRPPPPCGDSTPTTPRLSRIYQTTINGQAFNAINATFSGADQPVVMGNNPNTVTFQTVEFLDPSKPHLVGQDCITDPASPISLTLDVKFASSTEQLSMQYDGGSPPPYDQLKLTVHTGPQAGVRWFRGTAYLVLLVSIS